MWIPSGKDSSAFEPLPAHLNLSSTGPDGRQWKPAGHADGWMAMQKADPLFGIGL
jgi:hypothetical protein